MKVIIDGDENFPLDYKTLDGLIEMSQFEITEVVVSDSGNVRIAAEHWAQSHEIKITVFPVLWEPFGKRAGQFCNQAMADYAEALILIWTGRTPCGADLLRECENQDFSIFEARQEDSRRRVIFSTYIYHTQEEMNKMLETRGGAE